MGNSAEQHRMVTGIFQFGQMSPGPRGKARRLKNVRHYWKEQRKVKDKIFSKSRSVLLKILFVLVSLIAINLQFGAVEIFTFYNCNSLKVLDTIDTSCFSLVVRVMLVLAGIEVQPGPPRTINPDVDTTPPPPGPGWIVHDNGETYSYITPPMPITGHRVKIDRAANVDKYITQGIFEPHIKEKLIFSKTKARLMAASGKNNDYVFVSSVANWQVPKFVCTKVYEED
jgi:hypothetical protein